MCWGANGDAMLGDGTQINRLLPTQVKGLSSGIASITTGWWHTCALTSLGAAWCWGENYNGQVGNPEAIKTGNNVLNPTRVVGLGASSVVELALNSFGTCALTSWGGALCWGLPTGSVPEVLMGYAC